jgi:hypothetical protein
MPATDWPAEASGGEPAVVQEKAVGGVPRKSRSAGRSCRPARNRRSRSVRFTASMVPPADRGLPVPVTRTFTRARHVPSTLGEGHYHYSDC